MGLSWGVSPLLPEQHTGTEETQGEKCRPEKLQEDTRKLSTPPRLLGNGCSYKTHAAGSAFSPVNHNCKHTRPAETACLARRCWSTLTWVCWASTHLEGVELETGKLWFLSLSPVQGEAAQITGYQPHVQLLWQLLLTKEKRNHLLSTELFHLAILSGGKSTNSISLFSSLSCLIIKTSWATLNN